jgi:hypothetical protein
MKNYFIPGGLITLSLLSMASVHAESDFHALEKLSQQDADIASSWLNDSELDRVEGGLDILSVASDLGDTEVLTQAYLAQAALQNAMNTTAADGGITQNQVDRTTSLRQSCESQACTQSANLTTNSRI